MTMRTSDVAYDRPSSDVRLGTNVENYTIPIQEKDKITAKRDVEIAQLRRRGQAIESKIPGIELKKRAVNPTAAQTVIAEATKAIVCGAGIGATAGGVGVAAAYLTGLVGTTTLAGGATVSIGPALLVGSGAGLLVGGAGGYLTYRYLRG
jgi:hypothetical protein